MTSPIPSSVLSQHLRSALEGRKVVAGVFMAFTFEPEFFEQEIMTLLAGNELSQEPKLRLLQLQELLRADIGPVAVYYDQAGLRPDGPARLDVRYIPVRVRTGLFHPKIILLLTEPTDSSSTEPASLLCGVLSANLTKNGWWSSLECAHFELITAGDRFAFRGDLLDLLKELRSLSGRTDGHESLVSIRDWVRRETSASDHATVGGRLRTRLIAGTRDFLESLKDIRGAELTDCSLEVISPFFDAADSKPLRSLVDTLRIRETRVFLPTAADGSAICTRQVFDAVDGTPNAYWAKLPPELLRLGKDAKAAFRGVHAKVYRFIKRSQRYEALVVGSHNLTTPAHQHGGNFEASFVVERDEPGPVNWWLDVEGRRPATFKPEQPGDDEDSIQHSYVPLQLVYDWREERAEARWEGLEGVETLAVAATGSLLFTLESLPPNEWVRLNDETAVVLRQTLVSTSILSVTKTSGVVGIILVQETGMSRKPSIVASFSITDILAYWARLTPADRAAYLETHFQGVMPDEWTTGGLVERVLPIAQGFFETFSGIFHGFEMLRQQVAECLNVGIERKADYLLFGTTHDSLPHMIEKALVESDEADHLSRYLVLLCAQQQLEELLRSDEEFCRERRRDIKSWLAKAQATQDITARLSLDAEGEQFLDWFESHFLKRVAAPRVTANV